MRETLARMLQCSFAIFGEVKVWRGWVVLSVGGMGLGAPAGGVGPA